MKKTIRLFSILAILLGAVSCQDNELDNDQVIDDGNLTITATIVKPEATRVTYDVDNETNHTVTPAWTVGDNIIGFDNDGHKFTFEVASVDDGTGNASLNLNGYSKGNATKIYAIYAPGRTPGEFGGSASEYTLDVDLSTQNGAALNDNSPVLMCATADATGSDITLSFSNQTAIIGVTKFKLPAAATITSVSVDGLITTGKFELNASGDLVLTPGTTPSTITATGNWETGDGNICATPLYFATLPTTAAKIALRASDGVNNYGNLASIAATNIVAGTYYYMAKNLGAPVADVNGVKYGTIDDAFAAANRATSPVTITLLADCSASSVLRINTSSSGSGNVTFDMGTHTLTGVSNGSTINATDRNLTITGSTGTITSSSDSYYVLYAAGTAIITLTGGNIVATNYRTAYCGANATLNIQGGNMSSATNHSVFNEGKTNLSDGKITTGAQGTNSGIFAAIFNTGGTLSVTGGTLNSSEAYSVGIRNNEGGTTTISAGTIDAKWAMYAQKGTVNITGGNLTGSSYGIYLNNLNAEVNVSGGTINSTDNPTVYIQNGTANLSGGTFNRTGGNVVNTASNSTSVANVTGGFYKNTTTSSVHYAGKGTINVAGGYTCSEGVNPVGFADGAVAYVTGGCFNKPIQPKYTKDSESNVYVNVLNPDGATATDYPFTVSPVSSTPKVATVVQGSNTWESGTIECALKNADVRAKENGSSTVTLNEDCTATSTLSISTGNEYEVVLDLNDHTINSSISPVISSAGSFVMQDSGDEGKLTTSGAIALNVTSGATSIKGGSFVATEDAIRVSGGEVTINDGYFAGGASDVSKTSGSLLLCGGYYKNSPTSEYVQSGYTVSPYSDPLFNYQITVNDDVVATVNGVGYNSVSGAIAAANAYTGGQDSVRLTLADNYTTTAPISLSHTKPIVLDLAGHILTISDGDSITTTGILKITDSNTTKGKITGSGYHMIGINTSGAKVLISNSIIECTAPTSTAAKSSVIWSYRTTTNRCVITIEGGAKVYSTNKVNLIYAGYSTITLNECELTSGKDADNGYYCIYAYTGTRLTVNDGASLYSPYKSGTRYAVIHSGTGNSASYIRINGGWFNGGYSLNVGNANYSSIITLNGGYYNHDFTTIDNMANVVYGDGKSLKSCAETHYHETTKQSYDYTFKVE